VALRKRAVRLWLQDTPVVEIARCLYRSRQWVYKWAARYEAHDRGWATDRSRRAHRIANRVAPTVEQLVLRVHRRLASQRNPLGFTGADAVSEALADLGGPVPCSARTIHRILARHGLLQRRRRDRSQRGPDLLLPIACVENDVHAVDFIVGHYLPGGRPVVVFNRQDRAVGVVASWVWPDRQAQRVRAALVADWRRQGRPRSLQLDNDSPFAGGHHHPRSIGEIVRLALACRVTLVFLPERRPQGNARVERFNGLWQDKVWSRSRFRTYAGLQVRADAFAAAYNAYRKRRGRQEGRGAPPVRRRLPVGLRLPRQLPLCRGELWFIRQVAEDGTISVLNEAIRVGRRYAHTYVRAVVRTGPQTLSVYWRPTPTSRLRRIHHQRYRLREEAQRPLC